MMKQLPVTSTPNAQAFPEMGYPASAYTGINASLAEFRTESASAGMGNQSAPGGSKRPLLIVAGVVVLALVGWHFYYRK